MSPKPDVSEQRREQILDAAETVFGKRGFAEATMDDIVDEAGLSKGALYWYYKSKDAIILALLDRVFGRDLRRSEALLTEPIPASEKLIRFTRATIDEIAGMQNLLAIGYEFVARAARRKPVREAISNAYRGYRELLSTILQQGIESGELRPMDTEQIATMIIALLEGLALMAFVAPEWVDLRQVGEQPMHELLQGLLQREDE